MRMLVSVSIEDLKDLIANHPKRKADPNQNWDVAGGLLLQPEIMMLQASINSNHTAVDFLFGSDSLRIKEGG